ncbi:MAG TPA: zinc ribbon domain-containing protein [Anaerolineae bacterium]|nr:zinc ribbon domain-containing protein [Anaerolineae bacterium]HNT05927.1 zinc ribbon domain-containing protein [Anaerolineae bacterium]HOU23941.1 zinc ribbon domain-containing protein [Anaerolineae bacterium]HQJ51253.1 zinc ribbon domain-containing protein [Anaerolineae bacterium]
MPLYEYICDKCHARFELLRSFSRCDEPVDCPTCSAPGAHRQLSRCAAFCRGGDGSTERAGGSCSSCGATSCAGCHH